MFISRLILIMTMFAVPFAILDTISARLAIDNADASIQGLMSAPFNLSHTVGRETTIHLLLYLSLIIGYRLRHDSLVQLIRADVDSFLLGTLKAGNQFAYSLFFIPMWVILLRPWSILNNCVMALIGWSPGEVPGATFALLPGINTFFGNMITIIVVIMLLRRPLMKLCWRILRWSLGKLPATQALN